MHMPFPSRQDGEVKSSCGVVPATAGREGLFPQEERDKEPEVLPEAAVSDHSLELSVSNSEISL